MRPLRVSIDEIGSRCCQYAGRVRCLDAVKQQRRSSPRSEARRACRLTLRLCADQGPRGLPSCGAEMRLSPNLSRLAQPSISRAPRAPRLGACWDRPRLPDLPLFSPLRMQTATIYNLQKTARPKECAGSSLKPRVWRYDRSRNGRQGNGMIREDTGVLKRVS
ncbi:hypothetical protein JZ751_008148 [Albula glossodonta]|uniref:Uncharacterized protein n=1 Tax=Albula glossodonta TaxID=121402 RepID=A0A8T2N1M8_9TELE|nr:hypothetical protein JZ751_008148 [Albula glossodonta]